MLRFGVPVGVFVLRILERDDFIKIFLAAGFGVD